MRRIVILLSAVALLWSCKNSQNMIYQYYDGSGNAYKIENQKIEYRPVSPSESSSGTYSGGKPFQKSLSKEEMSKIEDLFTVAFQRKEFHTDERAMMTGMIIVQNNDKKKSCILLPDSETKSNIELFLRQFQEE